MAKQAVDFNLSLIDESQLVAQQFQRALFKKKSELDPPAQCRTFEFDQFSIKISLKTIDKCSQISKDNDEFFQCEGLLFNAETRSLNEIQLFLNQINQKIKNDAAIGVIIQRPHPQLQEIKQLCSDKKNLLFEIEAKEKVVVSQILAELFQSSKQFQRIHEANKNNSSKSSNTKEKKINFKRLFGRILTTIIAYSLLYILFPNLFSTQPNEETQKSGS